MSTGRIAAARSRSANLPISKSTNLTSAATVNGADRKSRLVQLSKKIEHFGRDVFIHRALVDRAQSICDLPFVLGGRRAAFARGTTTHARVRGVGADIFPVPSFHSPFRR